MLDEIIARHENWEDLKQGLDDPSLIRMALVTSHADRAWLLDRLEKVEGMLDITEMRARYFAADEHDVGMGHQARRWRDIADVCRETFAFLRGDKEKLL